MSRRPRGTCPVCRSTLSLCWSGDIRVLRKHSASGTGEDACPGAGLPAVGELTEIHGLAGTAGSTGAAPDPAVERMTPAQQQRVASVA
ncbi:MAG: hypothetical protein QOD07_1353 [Frankiaceae bacterium]|nr:hypothetical protein [Frankiaceae bacterium]